MRTYEDMRPEFCLLGKVLAKFVQIDKKPVEFEAGLPLFPAEIHSLATICDLAPLSLTELARTLRVTKGAASQLLARLEDKGLVCKEPAPDNRSRIVIQPTPLGRRAQEAHMSFHAEHDQEFLARLGSLSNEQYETFSRICRWMDQWMDSYLR